MSADLAAFRARFPEFVSVTDPIVEDALEEAATQVSPGRWGALSDRGTLYLAAHLVRIREAVAAGDPNLDGMTPVSVQTVGDVSVSFGTYLTMIAEAGVLNLSPYGREYFRLRKLVAVGGIAIE